jgi:hypothetical protein
MKIYHHKRLFAHMLYFVFISNTDSYIYMYAHKHTFNTQVAAIITKYLKPDGHAVIALGSARSRYGVDMFEATLNALTSLQVKSEPYRVPKLQLHDFTSRVLQGDEVKSGADHVQTDDNLEENVTTMTGDPWGRAIDDFDIGSAESYCMFTVVKCEK